MSLVTKALCSELAIFYYKSIWNNNNIVYDLSGFKESNL